MDEKKQNVCQKIEELGDEIDAFSTLLEFGVLKRVNGRIVLSIKQPEERI